MASTFKNKWAENVNHSAAEDVYTTQSNTTSIVIGLTLTNNSSSDITATVTLYDAVTGEVSPNDTNDIVFLNAVSIPKNTALEIMRGNKIVLETGDKIKVQASAQDSLNVFATLLEIT
tara:strand:+ start:522 stop:875 length:354 start_codon:yes stop_codon:yes gene_type:complete